MTVCPVPSFNPNVISDLQNMWCYEFMRNAILTGTLIAIVAGVTGSS